jgi:hypothetical protein
MILNVAGSKVRISAEAIVQAAITAPNAKVKIQRRGLLEGCFCAHQATMDKGVDLICVGSASGAFVD